MKADAVEERIGGHKHSGREISRVLVPGWMKSEREEESRREGDWMDGETIDHSAARRGRAGVTQRPGGDYKKQLDMQVWAHGPPHAMTVGCVFSTNLSLEALCQRSSNLSL